MILCQVTTTQDGEESYMLIGEDAYKSMDELRAEMKNKPGHFEEGATYTLVEKRPYLAVEKTVTFAVRESK